jgi:CDP-diacylglycerol---glycerol-3-phosphate 3-phosphatidyltransferase
MTIFQDIRRRIAVTLTDPLIPLLYRLKISPDTITLSGLFLNIIAAIVISLGNVFAGGIIFLVAGLFDLLDGALARYTQQTTKFGGFLDSTIDRVTEAAIFTSLIFVTNISRWPFDVTCQLILIFLAMIGSFLTSYLRARAEGLGINCTVGLFTRAERVIILALGLLLNQVFIAVAIVVALSFFTVCQRFIYVWKETRK